MEIRYDLNTGAVYLHLAAHGSGDVHKTIEITPSCTVDLSRNGRVIGIELTAPHVSRPLEEVNKQFRSISRENRAILHLISHSPETTLGATAAALRNLNGF